MEQTHSVAPGEDEDEPATQEGHAVRGAIALVDAVVDAENVPMAHCVHARSATAVAEALKNVPAAHEADCVDTQAAATVLP